MKEHGMRVTMSRYTVDLARTHKDDVSHLIMHVRINQLFNDFAGSKIALQTHRTFIHRDKG